MVVRKLLYRNYRSGSDLLKKYIYCIKIVIEGNVQIF